MYPHFGGHGDAVALARTLRAALERTKTPLAPPSASAAPPDLQPRRWTASSDIPGGRMEASCNTACRAVSGSWSTGWKYRPPRAWPLKTRITVGKRARAAQHGRAPTSERRSGWSLTAWSSSDRARAAVPWRASPRRHRPRSASTGHEPIRSRGSRHDASERGGIEILDQFRMTSPSVVKRVLLIVQIVEGLIGP